MPSFENLQSIINHRRTTKAANMNGKSIPDEQIKALLHLADRAPNHAQTEPWRFWVYSGETLENFGKDHALLYWKHTQEEKRNKTKYDKLIHSAQQASHLIIVVMKRTENARIPVLEETAAVSAAVQNMLLGATALNIASIWSTGGMTHHPALKDYLGLNDEDVIMSMLYLGYTDEPSKNRKRNIPLEEKVKWVGKNETYIF